MTHIYTPSLTKDRWSYVILPRDITLLFREPTATRTWSSCSELCEELMTPPAAIGGLEEGKDGSRCPLGVTGIAQSLGSKWKDADRRMRKEEVGFLTIQ